MKYNEFSSIKKENCRFKFHYSTSKIALQMKSSYMQHLPSLFNKISYFFLATYFGSSKVARENGVPNAAVFHNCFASSTVINHLIHDLRKVRAFYRTFLQYHQHCEDQLRSPSVSLNNFFFCQCLTPCFILYRSIDIERTCLLNCLKAHSFTDDYRESN